VADDKAALSKIRRLRQLAIAAFGGKSLPAFALPRTPAMTTLGTPLSPHATKVLQLGSGELGKEVLIALQRLGAETIAVDRYEHAPGQQIAHHARTITMSDPRQLAALIKAEASTSQQAMLVVPEIEAIATPVLEELEAAGVVRVIPTARVARLTMDREGIRRLAAETLSLPTSPYVFANSHDTGMVTMVTQWQNEFELHARAILGLPVDTTLKSPGASAVIYGGVDAAGLVFDGVDAALRVPGTELRLFGKPQSFVKRRMGVALAHDNDVEVARERAKLAARRVKPRAA
jgi:formate-dependent phosphoribosylglycinamide formyltransferase (GAR transformylase)